MKNFKQFLEEYNSDVNNDNPAPEDPHTQLHQAIKALRSAETALSIKRSRENRSEMARAKAELNRATKEFQSYVSGLRASNSDKT